jgi:hypothetical protein
MSSEQIVEARLGLIREKIKQSLQGIGLPSKMERKSSTLRMTGIVHRSRHFPDHFGT